MTKHDISGASRFAPGRDIYAGVRLPYIPLPNRHDRMEPETVP